VSLLRLIKKGVPIFRTVNKSSAKIGTNFLGLYLLLVQHKIELLAMKESHQYKKIILIKQSCGANYLVKKR
jgi:hypothetical protein